MMITVIFHPKLSVKVKLMRAEVAILSSRRAPEDVNAFVKRKWGAKDIILAILTKDERSLSFRLSLGVLVYC